VNAYRKKQYANNPKWRVAALIRSRLNMALKVQNVEKSSATWELCGCDLTTLKNHLEIQFKDGMSWNQRGKWHIDHIRPVCSFDLSDVEQQKECFHYTNLQPLWAIDNMRKGATYDV